MPRPASSLAVDEVHVWRFSHAVPDPIRRAAHRLLAPDEQRRAQNFRFERDKSRFTVCRAALRAVLGAYSGVPPQQVALEYGPHGKPQLAAQGAGTGALRFNLSHADSLGLVAVAVDRDVGVDVERVRPRLALEDLARYSLSPSELAELETRPGRRQTLQFLTYWTRKEAYLKARGEGLGLDLQQLDVRQSEPCGLFVHAVTDDARCPDEGTQWCVRDFPLGADHVAAVAAASHGWHVRAFPLSLDEVLT